MNRERVLKVVLVVLGLLFCAGSGMFIIIGVALIALAPTKQSTDRTVAVGA
jgi:hypothetical protein